MILFLIAFQCQLFAQKEFNADSVPAVDGKVVFRVEFKTDLEKDVTRSRIKKYLNEAHIPYSGEFVVDNDDFTVCRVIDYIDVSSSFLNTFAMYMAYNMSFEHKDNLCVMVVQQITFMEKEYFEAKEKAKTYMSRELNMPEYTGEDIMLHENYKLVMISNASKKVTNASIDKINSMIKELEIILYRKTD